MVREALEVPWDVNLELYFHVRIGFRDFFFSFNLRLSRNIDSLNSIFTLVEQQGLLTCLSPPVHAVLINWKKGFSPLSHIFLEVPDYVRLQFLGAGWELWLVFLTSRTGVYCTRGQERRHLPGMILCSGCFEAVQKPLKSGGCLQPNAWALISTFV